MRIDGRPEAQFHFARQPKRLFLSFLTTFLMEAAVVACPVLRWSCSARGNRCAAEEPPIDMVFLANQPGPRWWRRRRRQQDARSAEAGRSQGPRQNHRSGGARRNRSRRSSNRRTDRHKSTIPVQTLSAGVQDSIGAIQMPTGPPTASQGSGSGGGAGTGSRHRSRTRARDQVLALGRAAEPAAARIVPVRASSIRSQLARWIRSIRPTRRSAALKGKCGSSSPFMPNGLPSDVHVIRSLDSRIRSGSTSDQSRRSSGASVLVHATGKPVPVIVSIAIDFSIR